MSSFKGQMLWEAGADPHPVPGMPGGSPSCLWCCFPAPGPLPCPLVFPEDFRAAPAVWVSESSCLFTPLTARVAPCPVILQGPAVSWIQNGCRLVLRAKCMASVQQEGALFLYCH